MRYDSISFCRQAARDQCRQRGDRRRERTTVDFSRAVDELADRGYERVLCEGGPTLMHDVVASGRLDELCLTLTTRLVSGRALRLTSGEALDPPYALRLTQLLEQDGELFARYTRA
ncbi:MAG: dihydrofolate reductase family protein [Nocardioidaceae bacterium]